MSEIEIVSKHRKLVLDDFKAVKNNGVLKNEEFELTDKHMELIAESVLQVIYNLGIASDAYIDYSMRIEGGTSYHTAKDEVLICPTEGEHYRRRIRNDRNIFKKKNEFEGDIELPKI